MSAGSLFAEGALERVRALLDEMDLDGWLLYDFHGQNAVSRAALELTWTTRRGFAWIPRSGEPVALIHAIEASSWRRWPWARRRYAGWKELERELAAVLEGAATVAMEYSPGSAVPTLDLVPAGTIELVRSTGVEVRSSGELVSAFHARWAPGQLERHRRDAHTLAQVALAAFERAAAMLREGGSPTEGGLKRWVIERLRDEGLRLATDAIVAVGPTASDPHYDPGEQGRPIVRGDVLLIDLWAKSTDDGVPADQTWMAVMGSAPAARTLEVWGAVRAARDRGLEFLAAEWSADRPIRGADVDDIVRRVIDDAGFGPYFIHRTGHSIDRDLHGSGPNLDNLETRDDRLLIPGVGFSVEPGVYLPGELGVRSEVNVFMGPDGPQVTGPPPQEELFLFDVG